MAEAEDPNWRWFPPVKTDWSLDVVNLLVVIGESAMIEHSQPITASLLCVLPRIIPAPQIFLKPTRSTRMPETPAKMTGVYSGTTLDSVGFFANIITPLDEFSAFSFKVLDIKHSEKCKYEAQQVDSGGQRWYMRVLKKVTPVSKETKKRMEEKKLQSANDDEENARGRTLARTTGRDSGNQAQHTNGNDTDQQKSLRRRKTTRQTIQDLLSHPTMVVSGERPAVPARLFSPIHLLGVISFFVSVAIIVCAVIWEDGNAILAISGVSLMSTVTGFASFWRPLLMSRRTSNEVPQGDVMIRTREGAFILVRCTEDVARELYSGTEECQYYVNGKVYRLLMAVGTVLLMMSVVLLGNCTWNSQVFIGGSYIILNGAYWGLGMLPRSYFWDLSRYEWKDATPSDAQEAHEVTESDDNQEGHPSFTRTLWFAIRETKRTGWVQLSGAAPGTSRWKTWLKEAEANAKRGHRGWNAVERKNDIMKSKSGPARGQIQAQTREAPAQEPESETDEDMAMDCAPALQIARSGGGAGNSTSMF